MSNANPYAPPAPVDPKASYEAWPLPPGFQRYKLDPLAARALTRRRYLVSFAACVAWFALRIGGDSQDGVSYLPGLVGGAVAVGFLLFSQKRIADRTIASYELITTPRIVRCAAPQGVAEILVDDMTEVRETGRALFFFSRVPKQIFGVPRTLLGYDELRARTASFRRIAPIGGWELWRRTRFARWHNEIDLARLAYDPSLGHELQALRSVFTYRPKVAVPPPRGRRVLILWVVLILMFFLVWQIGKPEPRHEDLDPGVGTPM